ncbi:MAG: PIN domain nuclease [Actinoplanes sp.]
MGMTGFLADTSAVLRILYNPDVLAQWNDIVTSGIVSMCAITELELLYTVRSKADRERQEALLRETFRWVVMPDRVFEQAAKVQADLTARGAHRSAGPVDLLTAATAEAHGLTLLHYDADFLQVSAVTGQRVRWVAEPGSVD